MNFSSNIWVPVIDKVSEYIDMYVWFIYRIIQVIKLGFVLFSSLFACLVALSWTEKMLPVRLLVYDTTFVRNYC